MTYFQQKKTVLEKLKAIPTVGRPDNYLEMEEWKNQNQIALFFLFCFGVSSHW